MSSSVGFPMLSGTGGASYAENSGPQKSVLLRVRPLIKRAIAEQQASFLEIKQAKEKKAESGCTDDGEAFRIADMGSSSGPNCLTNMQFMVDAIRSCDSGPCFRELQQFFCDLPSNDFNTLLQLQHSLFPADHDCYSAAVGGNVYGRLFPASFLHLVFSSYTLHWLSQIPKAVATPHTPEWNQGKIWVDDPLANEASGAAYAWQWQQDFQLFLKCRSTEMVKGGMMILLTLCRPDCFLPHQMQEDSCFRNLELSWQQLVEEGVLDNRELDAFNLPLYLPSRREIMNAVSSLPTITLQGLEIFEEDIGNDYWKQWSDDNDELSTKVNGFYKSLFWNTVEGHVQPEKCQAIFERFRQILRKGLRARTTWNSYWVYPWTSHAIIQILKTE